MGNLYTNVLANLIIRSRVAFSNIRNYLLAQYILYISLHAKLHTLMKKIVGKSKAEKLKSLHSMTMISVASTMTKEMYTTDKYVENSYKFLRRTAINMTLIPPQSTQRFNKVLTPLLSLQSPHK